MRSWSPAKRGRAILVLLMVILVGAVLVSAKEALFPFAIGIFLVYLLLPAVNFLDARMPKFLRGRRVARPLAILTVYVGLILLLVGFFAIFVPAVSNQVQQLVQASGQYTMQIRQFTKDFDQAAVKDWLERFYAFFPDVVQDAAEDNLQQVSAFITSAVQDIVSWFVSAIQGAVLGTFNVVTSTVTFVLGIVIIPFWVFYLLNDEKNVAQSLIQAIPEKWQDDVMSLETIMSHSLGGYIRGQLFLCFIVGAMATVGMMILRMNFSVLLGTIVGIFEVFPGIGPFIGAVPAVLVAMLKSPTLAVQTAFLFFIIQQIENTFLVPKVVGASVRLHPALVMVVIVLGNEVAGIWGMIIGVPIVAIVRDVFRYLYLRFSDEEISPQVALERVRPLRQSRRVVLNPWQQTLLAWGERIVSAAAERTVALLNRLRTRGAELMVRAQERSRLGLAEALAWLSGLLKRADHSDKSSTSEGDLAD
jgi:predicted PurR-regulated permease PerM